MEEKKISVIIPVYNSKKYLEACVQSIREQTYRNLEIILVDDGSTDGSSQLCDWLAEQDERILAIHQENGGLSAARNSGLEICTGDYITFVDSDDLLLENFVQILLDAAEQEQADIAISSFQYYYGTEILPAAPKDGTLKIMNRIEALQKLNRWCEPEGIAFVTAWGKLFKRSFWGDRRFCPGVWHEDEYIAHHLLGSAAKIVWLNVPLYLYRQHEESYTGKKEEKPDLSRLDLIPALKERCSYLMKEEPSLLSDSMHHLLWAANGFYAQYLYQTENIYRQKRKWLHAAYCESYWECFARIRNVERLKGALFVFCPYVYCRLSSEKEKQSKGNTK